MLARMKRGKIICDYSHKGERNLGCAALPQRSYSSTNAGSDNLVHERIKLAWTPLVPDHIHLDERAGGNTSAIFTDYHLQA